MNFEALAPYLAGPGAAVLVLLLVGAGVYRITVNYLVPVVKTVADRHMTELENANKRHENAVSRHMEHIGHMGQRYDRLANMHAEQHRNILEAVHTLSEDMQTRTTAIERKTDKIGDRLDTMINRPVSIA